MCVCVWWRDSWDVSLNKKRKGIRTKVQAVFFLRYILEIYQVISCNKSIFFGQNFLIVDSFDDSTD